jgi:hypothetical protein
VVTGTDIKLIQRLIANNPGASRRRLSKELCEAWQWKQANGAPRHGLPGSAADVAPSRPYRIARGEIRSTQSAGQANQTSAVSLDTTQLCAILSQIRPLEFRQVRRIADEPLFNSLLEQHHYLSYAPHGWRVVLGISSDFL